MSTTPDVARLLQGFFTERLVRQRQASPHTIAAYRDTFRLLLEFAQQRLTKQPSTLDLEGLDAPLIGAFLDHLEKQRGNSARTRNARLAATHSFFRYAACQEPSQGAVIQRVLAIPTKRHTRKLGGFLTRGEIEELLAAPARNSPPGRRDYALLLLAVQTGLRVSPHVLRYSTAMDLLQHGIDHSVIALWLGHESAETTQSYLAAELAMKERALAKPQTPGKRPPNSRLCFRYHPWYRLSVSKIRRGNYVFVSWKGDHSPRHVHVYKGGKLLLKWNLDDSVPMKGKPDARILQLIAALKKEGAL